MEKKLFLELGIRDWDFHPKMKKMSNGQAKAEPHDRSIKYLTPQEVAQQYTQLKFVGSGTFGKVFRAKNTKTGQSVALKYVKLKSHKLNAGTLLELATLRSLAPLCGKCHLICYQTHFFTMMEDLGKKKAGMQAYLVIVMQFVSGGDLASQADRGLKKDPEKGGPGKDPKKNKPLTAVDIYKIAEQLFEAVDCLHKLGYAHRDIKPANVLFHKRKLVLADYGLTCLKQLCTGTPGTPAYMWPLIRKFKGKRLSLDAYKAGDVYGAAKTILRLLQGPDVDGSLRGKLDGPSKSPALSVLMKQIMQHPKKYSAADVLQQLKRFDKL